MNAFVRRPAAAWLSIALLAANANDFPFNQGRLPEAEKMAAALCQTGVTARSLLIESARWRHRLVVFIYPINSNHLWVWDPASKSREYQKDIADPVAIANAWVRDVVPGEQVKDARYESGTVTCSSS